MGGGMVGCEAVLHLAMVGKDVTIPEMMEDVALDLNFFTRPALVEKFT